MAALRSLISSSIASSDDKWSSQAHTYVQKTQKNHLNLQGLCLELGVLTMEGVWNLPGSTRLGGAEEGGERWRQDTPGRDQEQRQEVLRGWTDLVGESR